MGGTSKMRCEPDRTLRLAESPDPLRFDQQGALVGTDGSRIYVRDSGEVEMALFEPGSRLMPWRIVGFSPSSRRTAELLVFAMFISIDWRFR